MSIIYFIKVGIFFDFRSDPDPESDPLFHDPDLRIWIQIKMIMIHNTEGKDYISIHLIYFRWKKLRAGAIGSKFLENGTTIYVFIY